MDTAIAVETAAPSPWRTMWFSPRVTIRRILDSDEKPSWTMVVALAAASGAIGALQVDQAGALSASRSAAPVFMGTLQLIFGVLVGPFLMAFVGQWFDGEADAAEIRQAVAWSYVPVAASAVLWLPILLTMGTRAFGPADAPLVGYEWLGAMLLMVMAVFQVWTLLLFVGGMAAAQRFSIGKTILFILVLSIPLFLLMAAG